MFVAHPISSSPHRGPRWSDILWLPIQSLVGYRTTTRPITSMRGNVSDVMYAWFTHHLVLLLIDCTRPFTDACLTLSFSHTFPPPFFFFVHFSPFSFRFAYGMTLRYCHSSCCSSWNITCRCSLLIYVFIFSDPGSVRHIMWIYQSWPILGPRNAVDPSSNASHVGYAQLNCIFVTFFFLWLTKWFRRFYWI